MYENTTPSAIFILKTFFDDVNINAEQDFFT